MSPPVGPQRVFGGQVAGQALVAAGRTVDPDRLVHSLHGYFVRPGDPTEPIEYRVENIRDGRSFSVRRSAAYQHGKPIFFMSASFQRAEDGLDHHAPAPLDVPGPDEVPTMTERLTPYPERLGVWSLTPRPIDVRYVGEPGWVRPGDRPAEPHQRVWMRIDGKLPDDPLLHACALTYASDLTLLDSVLSVHGEVWGPGRRDRGQPRPRPVVPPSVPGRRVVPLRLLEPVGLRRPRAGHRADVHRGRPAHRHRRAGRAAAPRRRVKRFSGADAGESGPAD